MAEKQLLHLRVNGEPVDVAVPIHNTLLEVLRENLRLTGTKHGCELGECGTCTVLVDGEAERSCALPLRAVRGREVVTIEGLARGDVLHPLQEEFAERGALQCGYCTPGMLMNAAGLLNGNPHPSRDEIVEGMEGNLCRCGAHKRIIEAIDAASKRM